MKSSTTSKKRSKTGRKLKDRRVLARCFNPLEALQFCVQANDRAIAKYGKGYCDPDSLELQPSIKVELPFPPQFMEMLQEVEWDHFLETNKCPKCELFTNDKCRGVLHPGELIQNILGAVIALGMEVLSGGAERVAITKMLTSGELTTARMEKDGDVTPFDPSAYL